MGTGFRKERFANGFKKYGIIVAIIGFITFYVGRKPFDLRPSVRKIFVEGVIYYIGVAIIEGLYVRGLLLNFIEKVFDKKKSKKVITIVLSSVIFSLGHILGVLNQPLFVIISKTTWTTGMGMYVRAIYKKTENLWLPIIIHFVINGCAIPYCFSSINGYANLTLYIILPTYLLLGIYSICIMKAEKVK